DYGRDVPAGLVDRIEALPGVETVEPQVGGPIALVNGDGQKVSSGGAPSRGASYTPPSQTVGPPVTFVAGHAPTRDGEVVLNQHAARAAQLHVGDRATVVVAKAGAVHVRLSGIYTSETATGGYIGVLFDRTQARSLFT